MGVRRLPPALRLLSPRPLASLESRRSLCSHCLRRQSQQRSIRAPGTTSIFSAAAGRTTQRQSYSRTSGYATIAEGVAEEGVL